MNHKRSIKISIAITATAVAAAFAPAAQAADVCNQARKGHEGSFNATDSDPNPPARNKNGLEPIGSGEGLARAAGRSPALSECSEGDIVIS